VIDAVGHALSISFAMTWEILWALILGFMLSAAVEAVVSKEQMSRLLPDDSARTLTVASLLGAASSSCSYAAVALARSLFLKGANFSAAMAFEIAGFRSRNQSLLSSVPAPSSRSTVTGAPRSTNVPSPRRPSMLLPHE